MQPSFCGGNKVNFLSNINTFHGQTLLLYWPHLDHTVKWACTDMMHCYTLYFACVKYSIPFFKWLTSCDIISLQACCHKVIVYIFQWLWQCGINLFPPSCRFKGLYEILWSLLFLVTAAIFIDGCQTSLNASLHPWLHCMIVCGCKLCLWIIHSTCTVNRKQARCRTADCLLVNKLCFS